MKGMKPLPMPIRVAAGLVATVLEEAEQLPRRLTELPVTAVSQALQSAMRVQQKVTDLAIKGDRALGALRPAPEAPTWARFDEDEEPAPLPRNGLHDRYDWNERYDRYDAEPPYEPRSPKVTPVRILPDLEPEAELDTERLNGQLDAAPASDAATEVPAPRTPAGGTGSDDEPTDADEQATDEHAAHEQAADEQPDTEQADEPAPTGPPGLEGYDSWSLPQLRARFRTLKPHQLQALVDWETEHQNRPPYLTMLSNRIASVSGR
jgi:hypothetical protein